MNETVIGPISSEDWMTMRMLRSSVVWMKQQNDEKFKTAIVKENALYQEMLTTYKAVA